MHYKKVGKSTKNGLKMSFGARSETEDLRISYGRSGHCAGSIWLLIKIGRKKILFTGDYFEHSTLYTCDRIRNISADCAVIDCAYGNEPHSMETVVQTLRMLLLQAKKKQQSILLPVPKYGRGTELISTFRKWYPYLKVYGDDGICEQLCSEKSVWYMENAERVIEKIENWKGDFSVLMIADPQLKKFCSQELSKKVLSKNGRILYTGHVYQDTYADKLLKEGRADQMIYPVHMTYEDVCVLAAENHFLKIVFNHSRSGITDYGNLTQGYKNGDVIDL